MKDSVILGTGNSRYLKSAIPAGTSWESALAMLIAGTFPIDFNGINEAGFTQVGTPLSKANLLKDATAEALGLTSEAVPDDALNAAILRLGSLDAAVFDHAAVYTWDKYSVAPVLGSDLGKKKVCGGNYESASTTFYYSDSVVVNESGAIELSNPSSVSISYSASSNASVLIGKYINVPSSNYSSQISIGTIYFVPSSASAQANYESTYGYGVTLSALQPVSVGKTFVATVAATTYDAYPIDDMQNGFYYIYKTVEREVPKAAMGSYSGTAASGSSANQTFDLGFTPSIVIVCYSATGAYSMVDASGVFFATLDSPGYFYNASVLEIADGGFLVKSAYRSINGTSQTAGLNNSGITYKYLAIL